MIQSFTMTWDNTLQNNLDLVASMECGAIGDGGACAGPWDVHVTAGVTPLTQESTGAQNGQHGSYSAANLGAVGSGGGLRSLVGTITFHVRTPQPSTTDVVASFRAGEQVNDDTGFGSIPTSFASGTVNVVPEPGTAGLFGLGLLGLAVAGRFRG